MKWSDEIAIGVARIDEQHKTIFKMSDDFQAALDDGIGERVYSTFLQFLDNFCKGHFHFEEHCMEKHGCPAAQKNKEAHSTFLTILNEFQHRFSTDGYLVDDANKLAKTVDQWLLGHICHIDVQLRDYVNE